MSIEFDDFRKIIINCIKFKILFPAPFDSIRQSFTGAAGPENEFVAVAFPFLEIFNQCMVGLTKLRSFAVTQVPSKSTAMVWKSNCFLLFIRLISFSWCLLYTRMIAEQACYRLMEKVCNPHGIKQGRDMLF